MGDEDKSDHRRWYPRPVPRWRRRKRRASRRAPARGEGAHLDQSIPQRKRERRDGALGFSLRTAGRARARTRSGAVADADRRAQIRGEPIPAMIATASSPSGRRGHSAAGSRSTTRSIAAGETYGRRTMPTPRTSSSPASAAGAAASSRPPRCREDARGRRRRAGRAGRRRARREEPATTCRSPTRRGSARRARRRGPRSACTVAVAHAAGRRTVKRAPSTVGGAPGSVRRPRAVLGDDRPRCASTICLEIDRPRPEFWPKASCVRAVGVEALEDALELVGRMPGPSSSTTDLDRVRRSGRAATRTVAVLRGRTSGRCR